MNTEHGDRLIIGWAIGGSAILALLLALFVVALLMERRRDRLREAEADAILRPAPSTVDERPMEEIALDGMTDDERVDADRDARLAAWFATDERAWLRTQTVALQADLIGVSRRAAEQAELSADALARFMGYRDGVVGLRADLLIAECHNDMAELADLVNTTCAWPQEWEDELADLLNGTVPA